MKIKCWECGEEFEKNLESEWETLNYMSAVHSIEYVKPKPMPKKPWKRFYCAGCEEFNRKLLEETKRLYIQTKTKVTLERAVGFLEKQSMDIYGYMDAIKKVEEYATSNPDKFDSSYEMIAAIILIKGGISIKPQHKIEKYRVDFYIPQFKCILEIDGERHKHRSLYDSNRDIKLRQILGGEWEVVRIPTKYLEQNAKVLITAIKQLKQEKQTIRNKNDGVIPAYYSDRDKAKHDKIENILKA